jgi:hypothetical protein
MHLQGLGKLDFNCTKEITCMSSGQWIKITKNLPEKPAMGEVRRFCGCTKAEAFLAFFVLFCYFDDVTADGFVPFCRKSDVDERTGIDGFGGALEAVGWLTFHADGARIVGWEKHNGKSAKRRLVESERKMSWRGQTGRN